MSIPACHAGDRGSIPRHGAFFNFLTVLSISPKVIESIFVEIEIAKNKTLVIGSIYRSNGTHPSLSTSEKNTEFMKIYSNVLDKIESYNTPTYLFMDSNIDILKSPSDSFSSDFLNLNLANGFINIINYPTRLSASNASLIDQIFSNHVSTNTVETGIFPICISDHFPIFAIIDSSKKTFKRNEVFKKRCFTKESIQSFNSLFDNYDWSSVLDAENADQAFNEFYEIFHSAFDLLFPVKEVVYFNKHKKKPWMTKGILKSRDTLLKLRKTYIEFPTFTNHQSFKLFRNIFNKIKREMKKMYYIKTLNENARNCRKTWQILNEISGRNSKKDLKIKKLIVNGNTITNKEDMANNFNIFFSNIASDIAEKIPKTEANFKDYLGPPSTQTFSFPIVSRDLVIETVKSMESKKSQDINGLSSSFLKQIVDSIATPLGHVFTLSFKQGIYPSRFKVSRVVPIFKSGDQESMNNYRPVGLIEKFSQVLEKIAARFLNLHVENNDLLYIHQYGFRKKHATIHPIIHLLNDVASSASMHEFLLALLCDLKKCFDVLDRKILLSKLENFGVNGPSLDWFADYFEGRYQFTDIENTLSKEGSPSLGVIQGSILGPLLCAIYLNDLCNAAPLAKLLLFADDSTFLFRNANLQSLIETVNAEFAKVTQWMRANKLKLHPEKTKYIIFCNNKKIVDFNVCKVFLNDNDLTSIQNPDLITELECLNFSGNPSARFLGVILDPHLTNI